MSPTAQRRRRARRFHCRRERCAVGEGRGRETEVGAAGGVEVDEGGAVGRRGAEVFVIWPGVAVDDEAAPSFHRTVLRCDDDDGASA